MHLRLHLNKTTSSFQSLLVGKEKERVRRRSDWTRCLPIIVHLRARGQQSDGSEPAPQLSLGLCPSGGRLDLHPERLLLILFDAIVQIHVCNFIID